MNFTTFWKHFDEAKLAEEILINSQFSTIQNWDLEKIKEISINYRWLVKTHSNHLALLVSRLFESPFKSLITDILNDEQGNGRYEKSHLYLWDNYLHSLGIHNIPSNPNYLDPMMMLINHSSIDFIIGLEGVGVECICSVYLATFERFLKQHPYIIQHYQDIDWQFFDIHIRGEDVKHKLMIREAVEDLIKSEKINPDLVLIGYNKAKEIWRETWNQWLYWPQEKSLQVSR